MYGWKWDDYCKEFRNILINIFVNIFGILKKQDIYVKFK